MDVQKKGNKIIVEKELKDGETYKLIKNKKFETISFYQKPISVKGITSSCEDGMHVLFIDYDEVPKFLVEQDYERLQKEHNLPKGYLFKTKEKKDSGGFYVGNYHLICITKHYPGEIRNMIMKTHADVNFMSMPLRNKFKNWVLRISPKEERNRPEFVKFIGKGFNNNYKISTAHLDMLKKLYPEIDHPEWENQDNLTKLFIQDYETMNY